MISGQSDIEVKDRGFSLYFEFMPWDSCFFKKNCYMLDIQRSNIKPGKIKVKFPELKNSFISVKVDTAYDKEVFDYLYSQGFKYINTELTLKYSKINHIKPVKPLVAVNIQELRENKGIPGLALVKSMNHTRFHCDSNIGKSKADELWARYIDNYRLSSNHRMFIARADRDIIAILLANIEGGDVAFFLVAVINRFLGKGVGSKLMQSALKVFKGKPVKIGTQISNLPALNSYIKNGFTRIVSTKAILHRWAYK